MNKILCIAAFLFLSVMISAQETMDIAVPRIPDYQVSVKDFDGDFNRAMQALAAKGGGRLNVPAGIWNTATIIFENNCELHLDAGALVVFTTDYDAYKSVETVYEGKMAGKKMSPLYACDKHDIAITGKGCFDGQGQAWRPTKKSKLTDSQWKALLASGGSEEKGVWSPEIKERVKTRPVLLDFIRCERVLLKDATFSNSPAWNIHPFLCTDVTIDGVSIRNPWYAQNGDGLDLECCNRAVIRNSTFDVGDDAICIKAGKDKEGRDLKAPCQNVLIENCTVYHGHGGFTIGSEMSSGVRNIIVRNLTFMGTDTGLRFKSTRGRGGVVENILIDGVYMNGITGDALTIDLYYANNAIGGSKDKDSSSADAVPAVTEETPSFQRMMIKNVVCQGAKRAIYINGLPEMPVKELMLKDCTFTADKTIEQHFTKDIMFDNVKINEQIIK